MKQVRRGVFETNSSSTHSICITDSDALAPFPFSVKFTCGEAPDTPGCWVKFTPESSGLYQFGFKT